MALANPPGPTRKPAPITYDPAAGTYIGHQGAIPDRAIRAQLDLAIRDSGDRLARYTERMLGGQLDLLSWRAAMQRELAVGHRLATVLARGGVAQMGPADWQAAGAAATEQYRWFTQWAAARQNPDYARSPAQELARARLYAGSYHTQYEAVRRRDAQARGDRQERSVLGPVSTEHCSQCAALAARGWVPSGTLPLPGTRACRGNCRCHLETRPIPQEAPAPVELLPPPLTERELEETETRWAGLLDTKNQRETAAASKQRIARAIGARMHDTPGWDDFAHSLENSGQVALIWGERDEGVSAALIHQWAITSADTNAVSIALQLAVEREFGVKGAAHPWEPASEAAARIRWLNAHESVLRRFVRAIYDETQAFLANQGICGVWLTRGQGWLTEDDLRAHTPFRPEAVPGRGEHPNYLAGALDWQLQPVSSYATRIAASSQFAVGKYRMMAATWVPRERIYSTAWTGIGCKSESEVVVLGGRISATALLFGYNTGLEGYRIPMRESEALVRAAAAGIPFGAVPPAATDYGEMGNGAAPSAA